MGTGFRSSNKL